MSGRDCPLVKDPFSQVGVKALLRVPVVSLNFAAVTEFDKTTASPSSNVVHADGKKSLQLPSINGVIMNKFLNTPLSIVPGCGSINAKFRDAIKLPSDCPKFLPSDEYVDKIVMKGFLGAGMSSFLSECHFLCFSGVQSLVEDSR